MDFTNDIKLGSAMEPPPSGSMQQVPQAPVDERDRRDFEQALEQKDFEHPSEKKDLDRPFEKKDFEQLSEKKNLDQPFEKKDFEQPSEKKNFEQPLKNMDFEQPLEKRNFEQPFERKDFEQPLEKKNFDPALEIRDDKGYGDKRSERDTRGLNEPMKKGEEPRKDTMEPPKAGIESLFSQMHSPVESLEKTAPTTAPAEIQPMDTEQLETLVSRILVSSPEKGSTEVRLTLEDNILKGTEISIVRDATGALSVKIQCTDPSTFQTLVASRNELMDSLKAHENAPVDVQMDNREGSGNEGDQRRRSQGLVKDEYGNYV